MANVDQNVTVIPSNIQIGSVVKESATGFEGTVNGVYLNFWKAYNKPAIEARFWLSVQVHPFTDDQINNEHWFHVLVKGGGAMFSCHSRLTLLEPPQAPHDASLAPTQPWSVWARVAATESLTGDYCLYLEDRTDSWRGELPVLFVDSGRFKPKPGDLIEGDNKQMIVYRHKKAYHFIRSGESLQFVPRSKRA